MHLEQNLFSAMSSQSVLSIRAFITLAVCRCAGLRRFGRICSVLPFLYACALQPSQHLSTFTRDSLASQAPAKWFAPLAHRGELTELKTWWTQFNDPMLLDLIERAQAINPTLAGAVTRIEETRATVVTNRAALMPSMDVAGSISRTRQAEGSKSKNSQADLRATWEIDLFGANRAGKYAAQARHTGAQALWHEARTSVAAEIATYYFSLRACEAQLADTINDRKSRDESAKLTELLAKAGFQSQSAVALARASAADGATLVTQKREACDLDIKAIVALSGYDEAALGNRLVAGTGRLPDPVSIIVDALPVRALSQRPDLYNAERELTAARADAAQFRAQEFPRLSLSGTIGRATVSTAGTSTSGLTWSLGPLALSIPIFDGGRRTAETSAVRFRVQEAQVKYTYKIRQAVREVEESLTKLQSAHNRIATVQQAVAGYGISFQASQQRFKAGFGSLFELEDARRSALQASIALIEVSRATLDAWVSLYRAAGGGWTSTEPDLKFAAEKNL